MDVIRALAAAQLGRLSRVWHTDIADPTEMNRLRARVIGLSAFLGLVSEVSGAAAAPAAVRSSWGVHIGIVVYLLAVMLWSRRGERIGDLEFLAETLISHVFAAVTVAVGLGLGRVSDTALSMMAVTVISGIFCGRRSHVAAQAIFGSAILAVAGGFGHGDGHVPQEISTGAFDLILVSAVVRLLRDAAVAGLQRARRGEVTDPLTGLANRRGLELMGGKAWAARARIQGPIAVLLVDVDHFKQINDTQGHAAGDDILRRLAAVISASVRTDDVAVRLGGEEFMLLCSMAPGDGPAVAERLRATVETELGITVSIGVHETWPGPADDLPTSLWTAVDVADRAMYVAKTTGRNRVVAAP